MIWWSFFGGEAIQANQVVTRHLIVLHATPEKPILLNEFEMPLSIGYGCPAPPRYLADSSEAAL
jgi:hypothetical protein